MIELSGKYNKALVYTENLEDGARDQIINLLDQDFIQGSKVRIMPDVHQGIGCVIGFTADMGDKLIPNIVGVDIGCGVLTIELGQVDIDLEALDKVIYGKIPSGKNVHSERKNKFDRLQDMHSYRNLRDARRLIRSLGTLGGGNHFIEVGQDDKENKYLLIHSGSRNLGLQVANIYQKLAIKECTNEDGSLRYPKDLCYLTGENRDRYLHDMNICKEYASFNREVMGDTILKAILGKGLEEYPHFHTIHNYISLKDNIIRKGAISAYEGEKVLIPINMRDGSILGRGKGNPDWNYSAPHGAGRLVSRKEAKEQESLEEFKKAMEGIYSTSIHKGTLDESPFVYKPMEEILSAIKDVVDVIHTIKPIYNFKA